MCGRFALSAKTKSVEKLVKNLKIEGEVQNNTNFAPTDQIAIVRNLPDKMLDYAQWGLIPSWAKDKSFGSKLFNARAETLSEKPSFRTAFKRRRCLIFADAFYEWKTIGDSKKKAKYLIGLKSGEPFTFAGLWETWRDDAGSILSTTIITTEPNKLMSAIHTRMPVIVPAAHRDFWLDATEEELPELSSILVPYPDEEMEAMCIE